jgi:polysaccharide export outer membrane protein
MAFTSACGGTRGGSIPYNPANFGPPETVAPETGEYRIAAADVLQVNVFQVPDLTREIEVDLAGNVSLPLVGDVRASGLTPKELQARLVQLLGQRYLRNPDVTVSVKSSSRRAVTVDGAVTAPGIFAVTGPTTLLQAIAQARGPSESANPHRVAVFRQVQGQRMAAAFDLTSIRRGESPDPAIYSGDIIVVDGSRIKEIQKQILTNLPLFAVFRPF